MKASLAMNPCFRLSVAAPLALAAVASLVLPAHRAWADEARVTKVVHDVKLLPSQEKPKPANVNDLVHDGTGVRTGDASRSELTFQDLTIERLGANTVFSFNRGGRSIQLDGGSMLLRVPKNSGGATMATSAVTVGITGTTVILESARKGSNRLIVLEGGAKLWLNKNRSESVFVNGGQMETVPAGATKLPQPENVDLNDLMKKNPLITDFPPLPSRDLIMNTAANPPVYQGQPVSSGGSSGGPPVFIHPPFIPIGIGPGGAVVGGATGGGGNVVRNPVGPVRGVGANPKNPGGKVNKNPGANHSVVANQVNANVAANPNANPKNLGRKIKKKPAPNPVVPAPGH